jgi:histidine triad (HIT) family protein
VTVFQKIIDGQIPADVVHEDDLAMAFRDVSPQAPTHILVIPKRAIRGVSAVREEDKEVLGHLLWVASMVAQREGLTEAGYRLVINEGRDGGQSVPHLHVHLLAGRALSWPPG